MYEGVLYTKNGSYPQPKPNRVRLPDGSTRTSDGVTHQVMLDCGFVVAPDYPRPTDSSNSHDWPIYNWDPDTSTWQLVSTGR